MLKRLTCLLTLLASSAFLLAQDVPITITGGGSHVVKVDQTIVVKVDKTVVTSFPFTLSAPADEGFYDWVLPEGVKGVDKVEQFDVTAAPKGEQLVRVKIRSAQIVDGKIKYVTRFGSVAFVVGDIVPPVPPPIPPTPVPPTPVPPQPVDPVPIPALGFRVMIVYDDTDGKVGLTTRQSNEVYGKDLNNYLNAKCVIANGAPEWRVWGKNTKIVNDANNAVWKEAFAKLSKETLPSIIISDGTKGYIGPLPDGNGSILALCKKYGG